MIPILLLGMLIGSAITLIALFLWGEINNKIDETIKPTIVEADKERCAAWRIGEKLS